MAGQAGGVCRLDLSAAALMISTHLSPAAPALAEAAVPAGLPHVEGPVSCAGAEDATEAAAPSEAGEAGETQDERGAGGKQRRQRVYVHGNYHRYYGYRFFGGAGGDGEQPEDPRLAVSGMALALAAVAQ